MSNTEDRKMTDNTMRKMASTELEFTDLEMVSGGNIGEEIWDTAVEAADIPNTIKEEAKKSWK